MSNLMIFREYIQSGNDQQQLIGFMQAYQDYLFHLLGFIEIRPDIIPQATENMRRTLGDSGRVELEETFKEVIENLQKTDEQILRRHGLIGPQFQFKVQNLLQLENELLKDNIEEHQRLFFGKILGDTATTIVGSALEAAGAGTAIKEIGDIAGNTIGRGIGDIVGTDL